MTRVTEAPVRVPRVADRFRERAERRAKIRRRLFALALVAAIIAGGLTVGRSKLFGLSTIEVAGTSRRAVVVEASGLREGQNMLALDLTEAEARVRALPFVADVDVVTDGRLGVRIVVTERAPVVRVRAGARTVYLDQTGAVFEGPAPRQPVPAVSVPEEMASLGRDAIAFVQRALAFWRALPETMREKVLDLRPSIDGSIVFTMGSTVVIFGDASGVPAKLRAIELVVQRAAASKRQVVQIDVRAPKNPAATLR